MAVLTEKEWSVSVNQVDAEFYAEMSNGVVIDIFVTLKIDGFNVIWSSFHNHGLIRVYEVGKVTNDWVRLLSLVGDQAPLIEQSLKVFLNENLTYKN